MSASVTKASVILTVPLRLRHAVRTETFGLLVVLLFCGFLFGYRLSDGEFYRNEGLRAIIAAEFLRSGDWIVPRLYGEPLLTKPPGMNAAIALVSLPNGAVSETTARLPSALAALGCVLMFYGYFRRDLGPGAGLVAALLMPLSLMWLDKASTAEIDMLQVFWGTAAILAIVQAIERLELSPSPLPGGKRAAWASPWLWTLAAFVCLAAGVLTKWTTPAFFYGTLLALLWRRGQLSFLWSRYHLVGAALTATLCLAWIFAVVDSTGWDAFYSTVSQEALMRLSPGHHDRPYPWRETLRHPFVILAASAPVSLFALPALWPGFARRCDAPRRRILEVMHCWLWPNLLFWSLIPEHAPRHSFPLFPALAGLAALNWWDRLAPVAAADWPRLGSTRRWAAGFITLLAVWLVVKLVFVHWVMPHRLHARHGRDAGERLAATVPATATLYLSQVKDEGVLFYYGRKARRLPDLQQLPSFTGPLYCILNKEEWRTWQRPSAWSLHLRDAQGDPLILVCVQQ